MSHSNAVMISVLGGTATKWLCSKMLGKENKFDGFLMFIIISLLKTSIFVDVYTPFFDTLNCEYLAKRVFRYQTEYLFRRACEYAMAQGVEVPISLSYRDLAMDVHGEN